jgi:hypothetical protein
MVLLVEGGPTSVDAVIAAVQHIVQSSRWAWHTSPPIRNPKQNGMSGYFREFFYIIPVLRIRDVYPGSRILIFTHPGSPISDPGSKNSNEREWWMKFVVIPFFGAINLTKFNFWNVEEKNLGQFSNFFRTFYPKIVIRLWIRKKPIPDPGSRCQKGTGSRIRIRNTA